MFCSRKSNGNSLHIAQHSKNNCLKRVIIKAFPERALLDRQLITLWTRVVNDRCRFSRAVMECALIYETGRYLPEFAFIYVKYCIFIRSILKDMCVDFVILR
jgi:hypothetical protein